LFGFAVCPLKNAYIYKKKTANKCTALAVAHLRIMDRVGLHHIEQIFLTGGRAKELVIRVGSVHVATYDLFARRLLLDVLLEPVLGVGEIGAAQILPRYGPQVDWYAFADVLFQLCGLFLRPYVPLGDYLIPQLPAYLVQSRYLIFVL
jgi:hypothetical protein